jgi:hypothetical protein
VGCCHVLLVESGLEAGAYGLVGNLSG